MKKLITLFLFLSSLCLNGQSLSDSIPTLDKLLEVKWVVKGSKDSSNPLINDGLVFETFGLTYALQAETGQKLYFNDLKHQSIIRSTTKDSIIFFSSEEGVAIVNIYKGKIIFKSKGIPYKPFVNKPRVIRDTFVYTALNDTTLVAIRIANGEIEWKKPCRKIFNLPLIKGEFIYYGDGRQLYVRNRNTGDEIWSVEIGEFVSYPQIISNILYVWIKDRGLIAYDLSKRKIIWEKPQDRKDDEYEIIIEGGVMFSNSKRLMAASLKNGKVLWINNEFRSVDSFTLGMTKEYIFAYKVVDDYTLLTASDKKTGKLLYEGFTTIYDNLKEPKPDRPLANLEGKHFRFGNKMYKNYLYAVDAHGEIFCFMVKSN